MQHQVQDSSKKSRAALSGELKVTERAEGVQNCIDHERQDSEASSKCSVCQFTASRTGTQIPQSESCVPLTYRTGFQPANHSFVTRAPESQPA